MKSLLIALPFAVAAMAPGAVLVKKAEEPAPVVIQNADLSPLPTPWTSGGPNRLFKPIQWFWGGRRYCFYEFGWRGPGYYRCGYDRRRGHGWGGPVGWHGWGRTYGGPQFRGRGWRDDHDGNGWHGGGDRHGAGEHHGGGDHHH